MQIAFPTQWLPRLLTFVVWAGVAASLVYWGLRAEGKTAVVTAPAASAVVAQAVDPVAVARLLGSVGVTTVAAVSAPNRYGLVGVISHSASGAGAALIAIDGKPAKPFSVGSKLEEGVFLLSVAPRRASLAPSLAGPASITLDLPAPKPLASVNTARGELVSVAPAVPVAVAPTVAPPAAVQPRLRTARTDDTQD